MGAKVDASSLNLSGCLARFESLRSMFPGSIALWLLVLELIVFFLLCFLNIDVSLYLLISPGVPHFQYVAAMRLHYAGGMANVTAG